MSYMNPLNARWAQEDAVYWAKSADYWQQRALFWREAGNKRQATRSKMHMLWARNKETDALSAYHKYKQS